MLGTEESFWKTHARTDRADHRATAEAVEAGERTQRWPDYTAGERAEYQGRYPAGLSMAHGGRFRVRPVSSFWSPEDTAMGGVFYTTGIEMYRVMARRDHDRWYWAWRAPWSEADEAWVDEDKRSLANAGKRVSDIVARRFDFMHEDAISLGTKGMRRGRNKRPWHLKSRRFSLLRLYRLGKADYGRAHWCRKAQFYGRYKHQVRPVFPWFLRDFEQTLEREGCDVLHSDVPDWGQHEHMPYFYR